MFQEVTTGAPLTIQDLMAWVKQNAGKEKKSVSVYMETGQPLDFVLEDNSFFIDTHPMDEKELSKYLPEQIVEGYASMTEHNGEVWIVPVRLYIEDTQWTIRYLLPDHHAMIGDEYGVSVEWGRVAFPQEICPKKFVPANGMFVCEDDILKQVEHYNKVMYLQMKNRDFQFFENREDIQLVKRAHRVFEESDLVQHMWPRNHMLWPEKVNA